MLPLERARLKVRFNVDHRLVVLQGGFRGVPSNFQGGDSSSLLLTELPDVWL